MKINMTSLAIVLRKIQTLKTLTEHQIEWKITQDSSSESKQK